MSRSEGKLPALATRVLNSVLPEFSREAILGDMQETFVQIEMERGRAAARGWYWRETLAALPSFAIHSLQATQIRRQNVNGSTWNENWFGSNSRLIAGIGFVFLLPALLMMTLALKIVIFGEATMSVFPGVQILTDLLYSGGPVLGIPVGFIMLGGIFVASVINFFAVVNIKIESVKDAFLVNFVIKRKIWNLILLGLVVLLGLGMDWMIS
jgi:hypothetical protein